MATAQATHSATGRRKTSVARVWLTEGTGVITVNDRPFEDYFPTLPLQNDVLAPFQEAGLVKKFDMKVMVSGGGLVGQAGAGEAPDLWQLFDGLKDLPLAAIRGANSDLLSAETLDRMQARHPGMIAATVPNRGHVPFLDEPEALAALKEWIGQMT